MTSDVSSGFSITGSNKTGGYVLECAEDGVVFIQRIFQDLLCHGCEPKEHYGILGILTQSANPKHFAIGLRREGAVAYGNVVRNGDSKSRLTSPSWLCPFERWTAMFTVFFGVSWTTLPSVLMYCFRS
jgi:hypothetical protein